jgi:hypothetical protein
MFSLSKRTKQRHRQREIADIRTAVQNSSTLPQNLPQSSSYINVNESTFVDSDSSESDRLENSNLKWESSDYSYSSDSDEIQNDKVPLLSQLRDWAIKHNVKHVALKDLLDIFRENFKDLVIPKDPRTLLETLM